MEKELRIAIMSQCAAGRFDILGLLSDNENVYSYLTAKYGIVTENDTFFPETFGLTITEGSMNNLLAPPQYKKITYNDNDSIDGSLALTANRKCARRTFSLMFHFAPIKRHNFNNTYVLYPPTEDYWLLESLSMLQEVMKDGILDGGMLELQLQRLKNDGSGDYYPVRKYHCVLDKIDKYGGFGKGKATLALTFVELNPSDRDV